MYERVSAITTHDDLHDHAWLPMATFIETFTRNCHWTLSDRSRDVEGKLNPDPKPNPMSTHVDLHVHATRQVLTCHAARRDWRDR